MAKMRGPKCRLCRREGIRLFLKGTRCDGPKCALSRREYPPGPRSWRKPKMQDYGRQLREKQKLKRFYGILERQFRRYFEQATRTKGNTAKALLLALEQRLDNVVTLGGFSASRAEARQMVAHGHFLVNGRRAAVASHGLSPGDEISVRVRDGVKKRIQERADGLKDRPVPGWISVDRAGLKIKVLTVPTRDDVQVPELKEQLIIEFCSK